LPHRRRFDVLAGGQQVVVAVDQHALEAPLEHRAALAMAAVVGLGVDAVDVAHQARQIGLAREQQQLVVVVQQAVGQHLGVETRHALLDHRQQRLPIGIILEYGCLAVTTRGHVIDRAGKFDA
jgi:hypothetical protein